MYKQIIKNRNKLLLHDLVTKFPDYKFNKYINPRNHVLNSEIEIGINKELSDKLPKYLKQINRIEEIELSSNIDFKEFKGAAAQKNDIWYRI
jgi:hypothetical protein